MRRCAFFAALGAVSDNDCGLCASVDGTAISSTAAQIIVADIAYTTLVIMVSLLMDCVSKKITGCEECWRSAICRGRPGDREGSSGPRGRIAPPMKGPVGQRREK